MIFSTKNLFLLFLVIEFIMRDKVAASEYIHFSNYSKKLLKDKFLQLFKIKNQFLSIW